MSGTDSDIFFDDIIKSFMNEYNNIDKQMERNRSSFKFGGSLSSRGHKVIAGKGLLYTRSPDWLS